MLLKVLGITFSFDSTNVLSDVTFEAKSGEILGIIGPNGSGKTTLIRCIFRALSPKIGAILIDGKDIKSLNRIELARIISVVFQEDIVAPFTVLETILMGRYPHSNSIFKIDIDNEMKKVISDLIKMLGLDNILDRRLDEVSGGERKRVHFARALVQQPRVLLLDEPTAHLDPYYQIHLMDIIRKYTKLYNIITIATFHDLSLVAKYCDKLIILKRGKIFAAGKIEDVLTSEILKKVYGVEMRIIREDKRIIGVIPDKILEVDEF